MRKYHLGRLAPSRPSIASCFSTSGFNFKVKDFNDILKTIKGSDNIPKQETAIDDTGFGLPSDRSDSIDGIGVPSLE